MHRIRYSVKGGENALAFYSRYYQPIPFVLRGYGAGTGSDRRWHFADVEELADWTRRGECMGLTVYAPASMGNVGSRI